MRDMRWLLVFPLAAALVGCGSGNGQVTGTVTYDGRPLKSGTIRFEATGSRPATGRIEDGKIVEVTTHRPGDGLVPGSHKVAIFANEQPGSAVTKNPGDATGVGAMTTRSLIPTKYNDPNNSGLTAEIKPGPNELKYELKSK